MLLNGQPALDLALSGALSAVECNHASCRRTSNYTGAQFMLMDANLMCICRLLGQLSLIQQQLVQPEYNHTVSSTARDQSLSAQVDRLGICFVIATLQVETAAQLLKVRAACCCQLSKTRHHTFVHVVLLPCMPMDSVQLQIDASGRVWGDNVVLSHAVVGAWRVHIKWLMGVVLMQDLCEESLTYQGAAYPGEQALTLSQLEQFTARVHASDA